MRDFSDDFVNIAHRGASAVAPENTMAAFEKAFELGADGVECDVQLSKDGVPVLLHDYTLERTTNSAGFVIDKKCAKLEKIDAGSWFSKKFKGERIPTLEALLRYSRDKLLVNIELKKAPKPAHMVEAVVLLLQKLNIAHQCLVTSFDVNAIILMNELFPACRTGLLAKQLTPEIWHGPWSYVALRSDIVDIDVLNRALEHKKRAVIWTVDVEQEMMHLLSLGAGRLVTNYPDRYVVLLQNHFEMNKNNLTRKK